MILLLIKCWLVAIAATCNSVMDTSVEHYKGSILERYNPLFWNYAISWKNKYTNHKESEGISPFYKLPFMQSFSDAWHLSKSVMIIALCAAISLTTVIPLSFFLIQMALYGIIWNVVFNLFYNHLLRK